MQQGYSTSQQPEVQGYHTPTKLHHMHQLSMFDWVLDFLFAQILPKVDIPQEDVNNIRELLWDVCFRKRT